MRAYLIGFFLMLITSLSQATPESPCSNLEKYLAHEPHVTGVFRAVCDRAGNLATAWTHPRVFCYAVDTDEMETYERVKSEFPVGSKFDGVFVYVLYVDPKNN